MKGSVRAAGIAAAVLVASAPLTAHAQEWTLDAYAGRAVYDPVSTDVGTNNGVLGLRYAGPGGGWFYLSAAAPIASGDAFWAATGLGRRFAAGASRLTAGLDLGAHGFGYRDPASREPGAGATLEALPFIAVHGAAARLELRSGLLHSLDAFAGETRSRTLHDTGARLVLRGRSPLELSTEARLARAEEDAYPYAGAAISLDHGRGELWASVGRWFSDALPGVSWGAGASVELDPRLELWAAVRQESSDPLYWNAPRRSWSVGASRRLGRAPPEPVPVPAPVAAEVSDGRVTIRIPLSEAPAPPLVAGDFSGWEPLAMTRAGSFWTVSLTLAPGVYHYAFRAADGTWFVPETVPGRRDDGFGGGVAVLVVP